MTILHSIGTILFRLFHIGTLAFLLWFLLGTIKYFWQPDAHIVVKIILVIASMVALTYVDTLFFPKEPTVSEQLYEISEEIGIDGMQDYVLRHWDAWDVIEYVLPN